MNVALVKPSILSYLQHRWMESFLCWAQWNKYVEDSSSLPSMKWSSHVTFNSFFTSESGLFSISWFCVMNSEKPSSKPSSSWDTSPIPNKPCSLSIKLSTRCLHLLWEKRMWFLEDKKKTYLTHYTWIPFMSHTSALSSKTLPFLFLELNPKCHILSKCTAFWFCKKSILAVSYFPFIPGSLFQTSFHL